MIESNTMVGTGTGMKVVCSRDELAQKLGIVVRAVSTRASVQILSGVLLRAEGGRLHLAPTDMELSLRSSVDAQAEGHGGGGVVSGGRSGANPRGPGALAARETSHDRVSGRGECVEQHVPTCICRP